MAQTDRSREESGDVNDLTGLDGVIWLDCTSYMGMLVGVFRAEYGCIGEGVRGYGI